jgi:three-Cys-motif partner protein
MKPPEYYQGREQTYLKHFFLERYLERVAYNIGSFSRDFVYVDGFSGPWQSTDEAFQDTSFMVAISKLRAVRDGLSKIGRPPRIRCLFIEKDQTAFLSLQKAIQGVRDVECHALNAEFEDVIGEVCRFVGEAFALVFIDPTGWTGFGLKRIEPILHHLPGEVIVNFMFDHINRFLYDAKSVESRNELFGGPGWEFVVQAKSRREEAVIGFYCDRMRQIGDFKYVTSTRILKPTEDRTYFHLVYGTRHPKGLIEFRKVEKQAIQEQERVRLDAKEADRLESSHQPFLPGLLAGPVLTELPFESERSIRVSEAQSKLLAQLDRSGRVTYDDALAFMLEIPLVFESDVKSMIGRLEGTELIVEGRSKRERVPKYGYGHVLVKK